MNALTFGGHRRRPRIHRVDHVVEWAQAGRGVHQAAVLEVLGDDEQRQQRQSLAAQGGVAHGLAVVAAEASAWRDGAGLGTGERRFEGPDLARRGVVVAQALVLHQLFEGVQRAVAFRVVGAAADHPLAVGQRPGDQRTVVQAGDADAQVVAFLLEVGEAVVHLQDDLQARVLAHEVGDDRRQPEGAEAHRGDDAQFAAQVVLAQGDNLRGVVEFLQRGLGGLVEEMPGLGRLDVARGAIEQADAEASFEIADTLADHRLGQAHALGRRRHAVEFGDVEEGFDIVETQAHRWAHDTVAIARRILGSSWSFSLGFLSA